MPNPQPSHVCKRLETVIKIQPCAPGITKHHLKALRDESKHYLASYLTLSLSREQTSKNLFCQTALAQSCWIHGLKTTQDVWFEKSSHFGVKDIIIIDINNKK